MPVKNDELLREGSDEGEGWAQMVAAADEGAGVWMIDFAKTAPLAPALVAAGTHTHRAAWEMGNQEDGYLRGIDSLIDVWTEL